MEKLIKIVQNSKLSSFYETALYGIGVLNMIKGKIRLGKLQNLKINNKDKEFQPPHGTEIIYDPLAGLVPGPLRNNPVTASVQNDFKHFDYQLESTDEDVFFIDKGLNQSYGIFGSPGCGKTYLLMFLLKQIIEFGNDDNDKFGGLIIDPKAALIDDIKKMMEDSKNRAHLNRQNDLIIINDYEMLEGNEPWLNILDCGMEAMDLGKALAIATQSAGVKAVEKFWPNEIGQILGATIRILEFELQKRPTLNDIITALLKPETPVDNNKYHDALIWVCIKKIEPLLADADPDLKIDVEHAIDLLEKYSKLERDKLVIDSFIEHAYGIFRDSNMKCFSPENNLDNGAINMYDNIIENGKIVLVSLSPERLASRQSLLALIKIIYQQTVLSRLQRENKGILTNKKRPIFFMADEFSIVATETAGEGLSDSQFFSQVREFQCLCLIAIQNIAALKNVVPDGWDSIYSNYKAKIFMAARDAETAETASKLAGDYDFMIKTFSVSSSPNGVSVTENNEIREKRILPQVVLTNTLSTGDAVVIGCLDGESAGKVQIIHCG